MKTPVSEEAHEEWVVINEEKQEWVQKLSNVLSENDIPSRIALAPGCSAGQCGCTFLLLVTKNDVQAALDSIDGYYMKLHPEIRESKEWADQDRCPACGHHVGTDARECPDCGLRLIIEES
jgi:rRNA maturation endonuclease Nob1